SGEDGHDRRHEGQREIRGRRKSRRDHREGHRRRAGYALRPRHLADDHGRDSRYSRANIQKAEPVSTGTNCSISAKTKVHSRDNRYTKREEPVTNHRLTARFVTGSSVL